MPGAILLTAPRHEAGEIAANAPVLLRSLVAE